MPNLNYNVPQDVSQDVPQDKLDVQIMDLIRKDSKISSMLPFGWTSETLLDTHTSKPYNPDIARIFYRAGYIESWGRGIQKICDACKELGVKKPEYIIHGEDIMVKFEALKSTRVTEKVTETLIESEKVLLEILRDNPFATYMEIADKMRISRKTVAQKIKVLKERGIIVRIGSAKKGHWEIRMLL